MKSVDIKRLVALPQLCRDLVELGVIEGSALSWELDGTIVNSFDASEEAFPAYTMEELCIALGQDIPFPGFPEKRPRAASDEDISWCYYFIDKSKNYPNGATACADVLAHCLRNSILFIKDVNSRLERKFKPF